MITVRDKTEAKCKDLDNMLSSLSQQIWAPHHSGKALISHTKK